MNALVATNHSAATIYEVSDVWRMAQAVAASGLFGMKKPEEAMALFLVAQAEGRHPASAAQDYHIINGRPAKKADAMLRDFIASGGKVEWHALTDEQAVATFTHPAGGSVRIGWDHARARAAGINNPMWKKYPRQMLRSRVVSEGVRTVCPSATSGMYVPEEVADFDDAPSTPAISAPAAAVKSSAQAKREGEWDAITAEIAACETVEDVLAWEEENTPRLRALPAKWRQCVSDEMLAKIELLRAEPARAPQDLIEGDYIPAPVDENRDAWAEWRDVLIAKIKRAESDAEVDTLQRENKDAIVACNAIFDDTVSGLAALVDAKKARLAIQSQDA